nr:Tn3 family transposase [Streptomyces sp. TLI_235]
MTVKSLHAGLSPRYFGLRRKGATWLNVVNDQVVGLGGVVVPGTLRDSLFILDALRAPGRWPQAGDRHHRHRLLLRHRVRALRDLRLPVLPTFADISDARLWRTHATADYGPRKKPPGTPCGRDRVRAHWGDVLRVAGSLTTGDVRGYDLLRMPSRDGAPPDWATPSRTTGGSSKPCTCRSSSPTRDNRRMIGKQPNITEARHRLAPKIFFGQRSELRQHYREGMVDRLGALDLALNAVLLWNSVYLDAAAKQLAADGFPVTNDLLARLSPLQFDHINFLGRYAFTASQPAQGLRPLRDPVTTVDVDEA